MKILHVLPQQMQRRASVTNVAKRYTYFWEVAASIGSHEIESYDQSVPGVSFNYLAKRLLNLGHDLLVLLVRPSNAREAVALAKFAKYLRPDLKVLAYGDAVRFAPQVFTAETCVDALVTGNDFERSIESYADFMTGTSVKPIGILDVQSQGSYCDEFTNKVSWSFAKMQDIPMAYYHQLLGKKEMTLTVSRGCPYACSYCDASVTFGRHVRSKEPKEIVDFCLRHIDAFDTVRFFAPNFTLEPSWVSELCSRIKTDLPSLRWCCTSRLELLRDDSMLAEMASAGCFKLAVGIETAGGEAVIENKRHTLGDVADLARRVANHRPMTLYGLIMLGVPGQTREHIYQLFQVLTDQGAKIRPTAYTPLATAGHLISLDDLAAFDKITFGASAVPGLSTSEFARLMLFPNEFREILQH